MSAVERCLFRHQENPTQQWISQSRGVLLSSREQRLDPGWVCCPLPVLSGEVPQAHLLKLFHMCPHPDGSYSPTHQAEIPANRNRMRRTPPEATHTTCVYIRLARTWLQRRLGNVVLVLGGHVHNQKFYTETGTDLGQQLAMFAIQIGGSGFITYILL